MPSGEMKGYAFPEADHNWYHKFSVLIEHMISLCRFKIETESMIIFWAIPNLLEFWNKLQIIWAELEATYNSKRITFIWGVNRPPTLKDISGA